MRKVLYVIIVALLLAAPVTRLDVAQLEPVEVVYIAKEGGAVQLATDTGAKGEGQTLRAALADLKNRTPGVVYMDTAEYLLVNDEAVTLIKEMRELMKGSVKLCRAQDPDMKIAGNYLETHGDFPQLKQWKEGMNLPIWRDEKISEK